jgi:hypothetical protein
MLSMATLFYHVGQDRAGSFQVAFRVHNVQRIPDRVGFVRDYGDRGSLMKPPGLLLCPYR